MFISLMLLICVCPISFCPFLAFQTPFLLPYVPFPTSMPSVSPRPSSSFAPTVTCLLIEVIINFDASPYDTLWQISSGGVSSFDNDDAIVVASSSLYSSDDAFGTRKHSVCLPGKGRYTFSILKSGGLCCSNGAGGFILVSVSEGHGRDVIAEGGEFDWTENVTFDLPLYVSPRN